MVTKKARNWDYIRIPIRLIGSSMKKITKMVAWGALSALSLSALFLAGLYFHVAKPYINRHEWRASEQPTTIEVVYVNMACGEHSPRLYEAIAQNDGSQDWNRSPTLLALPKGIPSPEESEFAVGGNVFVLTGYRYRRRETNILTGATKEYIAPRFDAVAWEIRTPYNVWTASGKREMRHEPYRVAMNANGPGEFAMRAYHVC